MSGALCAAALAFNSSPPTLTASVGLNSGSTAFNVTGAAGDFYTQLGLVIVIIDSGGTPPYSDAGGSGVIFDGSTGAGGVSLVAAGDGVHNTVAWSGMAVGETISFHLANNIVDSGTPAQTANSRAPSVGSFTVTRTS